MSHRANSESHKDPDLVGKEIQDEEGARADDPLLDKVEDERNDMTGPIQLDAGQQAGSEHPFGNGASAELALAAEIPSNTYKEAEMGSAQYEPCSEGSSTKPPAAFPPPESGNDDFIEQTERL